MKIQINSRFTAAVLFEHDTENNSIRMTLELAIKNGANLNGADLSCADLSSADLSCADLSSADLSCAKLSRAKLNGADLSCADLSRANLNGADLSSAKLNGADLSSADLSCADLSRANLNGADLSSADLSCADLSGADLSRADLSGANLKNNENLVGNRPIFQIGPIGSRCAYFVAYITDKGLRLDAGCQRQITREVFESRLTKLHGENEHAREYRAALALIDAHAEIWTPKEDAHVIGADPSGMDDGKK